MEQAQVIRLNEGNHIQVDLGDVGYRIYGPATVVVIKEEAAGEAAVKCQYHGCTEKATEHAVGYDENGDDHVYQVCLKHAAEMEPRVFGEKLAAQGKETQTMVAEIKAAIEQGKMTLNEARITVGLEPLDNHVANVLIKKV